MLETTEEKLDAIRAGIHLVLNKLDRLEGQFLATASSTVKEIEATEQGRFARVEPPK